MRPPAVVTVQIEEPPTPYNAVNSSGWGSGWYRELATGTETVIGQVLVDANACGVNDRYGEDYAYIYSYAEPTGQSWAPVDLLKATHCLAYQCCDATDWEASEAKRWCDALADAFVRRLPGYEAAPWGIRPDSVTGRPLKGSA